MTSQPSSETRRCPRCKSTEREYRGEPDIFTCVHPWHDAEPSAAAPASPTPPRLPVKEWVESLRESCLANYGGGHHTDGHLEAFQHGMETVCNVLAGGSLQRYLDAAPTSTESPTPQKSICAHCAQEIVCNEYGTWVHEYDAKTGFGNSGCRLDAAPVAVEPAPRPRMPHSVYPRTGLCLFCAADASQRAKNPICDSNPCAPWPPVQNAQWISVEKELPPDSMPVFMWISARQFWDCGQRYDGEWRCERTDGQNDPISYFDGEVSHWLPQSVLIGPEVPK